MLLILFYWHIHSWSSGPNTCDDGMWSGTTTAGVTVRKAIVLGADMQKTDITGTKKSESIRLWCFFFFCYPVVTEERIVKLFNGDVIITCMYTEETTKIIQIGTFAALTRAGYEKHADHLVDRFLRFVSWLRWVDNYIWSIIWYISWLMQKTDSY